MHTCSHLQQYSCTIVHDHKRVIGVVKMYMQNNVSSVDRHGYIQPIGRDLFPIKKRNLTEHNICSSIHTFVMCTGDVLLENLELKENVLVRSSHYSTQHGWVTSAGCTLGSIHVPASILLIGWSIVHTLCSKLGDLGRNMTFAPVSTSRMTWTSQWECLVVIWVSELSTLPTLLHSLPSLPSSVPPSLIKGG